MEPHCVNGKWQWIDWILPSNWMRVAVEWRYTSARILWKSGFDYLEIFRTAATSDNSSSTNQSSFDGFKGIWSSTVGVNNMLEACMETSDESTSFSAPNKKKISNDASNDWKISCSSSYRNDYVDLFNELVMFFSQFITWSLPFSIGFWFAFIATKWEPLRKSRLIHFQWKTNH